MPSTEIKKLKIEQYLLKVYTQKKGRVKWGVEQTQEKAFNYLMLRGQSVTKERKF